MNPKQRQALDRIVELCTEIEGHLAALPLLVENVEQWWHSFDEAGSIHTTRRHLPALVMKFSDTLPELVAARVSHLLRAKGGASMASNWSPTLDVRSIGRADRSAAATGLAGHEAQVRQRHQYSAQEEPQS